jgi:ubiquitin carboxyl-terminal hydrolase 7
VENAGLSKDTAIQLFEEVKPTSIDPLKVDQSFKKAELQHGDIITFQRQLTKQQ